MPVHVTKAVRHLQAHKRFKKTIRYCLEWTPTWISILCNLTLSCHLLLGYPACSPSMDVKLTSLHLTMSQFLLFYYCSFMLDLLFLLVWGFQQVFLCSLGWLQTFILAVLYSAFSVLGLQAYISTSGSNFLKYFFFSSSLHLSVCVGGCLPSPGIKCVPPQSSYVHTYRIYIYIGFWFLNSLILHSNLGSLRWLYSCL